MPIDRSTLKILADYSIAAAESMAYTLMRTAHSTFVKETEDFACQLITPEGVTFASPKTLGGTWFTGLDYGGLIRLIDSYEDGDVCITSDPYSGFVATHSPDVHLWKPIFHKGELVCFAGCNVHNTDVGGAVPASLSRALVEIHQEGLRIPPMKLVRAGVFNEDIAKIIDINVRMPNLNQGDMHAQLAAVSTGERKIHEMIERFGLQTVKEAMPALLDYAEHQARELVRAIPDGEYFYADYADEDSVGGNPCRVALTLRVHGDTLTMDFTGSDPQLASALNMPTGGHERHALVMIGLTLVLSTLDPGIMLNYGTYRVARAILPRGSVMNAVAPAAVGMRSLICMLTQSIVIGAFSRALPERLPAIPASTAAMLNVKTSDASGRTMMSSIGPVGGGGGGARVEDGDDGAGSTAAFLRNTPVEINESELPIRILHYGVVKDSGGAGLRRGGLALRMDFQIFSPNSVVTARNRSGTIFSSPGICGGMPGGKSSFRRTRRNGEVIELGNTDVVTCEPMDTISVIGSGGGGYGDPRARPAAQVLRDVKRGHVSPEAALRDYGVALTPDLQIDEARTARERGSPTTAPADGHFRYCENRQAFEQIWTPARYRTLTQLLSGIPVQWRFFVKSRLFEMVRIQPEAGDGSADVADAFSRLKRDYPALAVAG